MNAAVAAIRPEYDRTSVLRPDEREALALLAKHGSRWREDYRRRATARQSIQRLITPLEDVFRLVSSRSPRIMSERERLFFKLMHAWQVPCWQWTREQWLIAIQRSRHNHYYSVLAAAYLLGGLRDLDDDLPPFRHHHFFARMVLGAGEVDAAVALVNDQLRRCGYREQSHHYAIGHVVSWLLLRSGSTSLGDITAELIRSLYDRQSRAQRRATRMVVVALRTAGILDGWPIPEHGNSRPRESVAVVDVPEEWLSWCQRWLETSTLSPRVRSSYFYTLLKVGRWLGATHPDVTSPTTWSRDLAVNWIAAVDRMAVGDWSYAPRTRSYAERVGQPLSARTKAGDICALRSFFRDLQEWEWIPRRFDPRRVLAVPRSIKALIGPDPRCIPDDVWAKLVWAGLNLTADDLPEHGLTGVSWYPFELVRAVVLLWLFAGLRANEIVRLRFGCIRTREEGGQEVCFLEIPVHKTGTAFTKPVDPVVGRAVAAWEEIRPEQPPLVDHKTGEAVQLLFALRGHRMDLHHINRVLIPMLCRKANVPLSDAKGRITSHRARSTIATQLYNAKEPMTLFELQAWLGHKSPASTQHYAKITPTTLAKAYTDAGYFARNVRAIEVLIDRDSVDSGSAGAGKPWQYFDLGHGYCTYNFFEQCPHRMACARCDFYVPKDSTQSQLLEAKKNLQRMLVEIPLTEDERAAVDEGAGAVTKLLERLTDTATPAGPTPRQLALRPLPMAAAQR